MISAPSGRIGGVGNYTGGQITDFPALSFWTDFPVSNLPVSDLLHSSLPWYSNLFLDRMCLYLPLVGLPVAELHSWMLFPALYYLFVDFRPRLFTPH